MGLWGWLTKAPKTLDKLIDGAMSAGDKLILTEEERLDYNKEVGELAVKFVATQADANSVRSKARRVLAILLVSHELLFLDMAAVLYLWGNSKYGDLMLGLASLLATSVAAVVIFYFGYYGVQNGIAAWKKK